MRTTRIASAAVLTLALTACVPHADYVRADAVDYEILSPYTTAGIEASDHDAATKQDLRDKLAAREFRIRMNGGFDVDR